MTRAAIYGPVSTADGCQEMDNQLDELRRFAATQNRDIVAEYIDHESGGHADRPRSAKDAGGCGLTSFRRAAVLGTATRLTREGALETLQYPNQLTLQRRLPFLQGTVHRFMRRVQ
jgi:hypothetical protein